MHALTLACTAPACAAEEPFDAAMRALDRGSTETLVFQRPCHSTVEETEAVLLGLWRLVRADRVTAARATAAQMIDPAQAPALVSAMKRTVARG